MQQGPGQEAQVLGLVLPEELDDGDATGILLAELDKALGGGDALIPG